MANIARIVQVSIGLRTAGVRQQTFSDLMLVGLHSGADRVSVITAADDLLDVAFGVQATDPLYRAAQVAFSQIPAPRRLFIGKRTAGEAIGVTLAACATANNDWYGFSEVTHAAADLLTAAAWAEANGKLYLTVLSDAATGTAAADDDATDLKTGDFFRTAWWYHPDPTQFPEVACAARAFTTPPGGETWANLRLSGVPSTPLTETQYTFITAKNGNTFEPFVGTVALTQNGKTAAGEWIDIIRGRDWLCEEIRTRVFLGMVDNRIPYTDQGIAIIRQRITEALDLGVRRGLLAPEELDPASLVTGGIARRIPSYTVSVPLSAEVSQNDKANRILRDLNFTARLAGAVNAAEIRGVLTYNFIGEG